MTEAALTNVHQPIGTYIFTNYGATSLQEMAVLGLLAAHGGVCHGTQSIADTLGVDRGVLFRNLRRLDALGLIAWNRGSPWQPARVDLTEAGAAHRRAACARLFGDLIAAAKREGEG